MLHPISSYEKMLVCQSRKNKSEVGLFLPLFPSKLKSEKVHAQSVRVVFVVVFMKWCEKNISKNAFHLFVFCFVLFFYVSLPALLFDCGTNLSKIAS